ncbi:MAG: cell surface protein SprA [Chlorobi bacterium]|nr:cell surface protein SprA [Chlorobiota bacterium]
MQTPDTSETELKYEIDDETGNPYLDEELKKGINLKDPDNLDYSFEYDYKTGDITIYRKIGNLNVRLPYTMSLEEFLDVDTRKSLISYWNQKRKETDLMMQGAAGKSTIFNPNWNVGGQAFQSVFGSNVIDIRLQGMAQLSIGIQRTKIDNPTLQERLRKTSTFDFDQKIQMNITGKIGDKLKLGVNYDTEATFDFENQIKLEFEGDEDDIIKSIEVGNVSLQLPGTLITGSQSLFGLKTEMQFGKLTVTSLFSQQKGETKVMNIEGGAQTQEFEIQINDYDENRHFFLNNFFRSLYDQAMSTLPTPSSQININKIEVWVTNKVGNFDESRNIIGFLDLGENSRYINNDNMWSGPADAIPSNDANNLYDEMNNQYSAVRDINQVSYVFAPLAAQNFIGGKDYEKIENARMLSPSEYTINPTLGYISLNSALNDDEVLAVAYEYTYRGRVYKVGEFSSDGIDAPKTLFLKLIKGTNMTPQIKEMWDLMMKNIYSIGAYNVNKEDFQLDVVYINDSTGTDINYFPEGLTPEQGGIKGELFLRIMGLDNLNSRGDPQPDGVFDFVQSYTIRPDNGRIIFPVLEPFGSHLKKMLNGQQELIDKYVYQALYDSTLTLASENAEKNKFLLKGKYKSASGSEIPLNAMNIPQGSVIVTAGGLKLVENVDYTVDYTLGRVKIINTGLLESGTPIQVSLENQSLFNLQTKTLMGTHLDYQFNDNFNIGATLMHLRERPLTEKVNIGDEPIANTIWGLNASFFTESDGLTRLIDKLPLIQTKETSNINFEGEFAQLIPGHPKVIDKEGSAYIDDFEGTKISYDIKNWTAWKLASTPQGQNDLFPEAGTINDLSYGANRAKLAWYVIDPLFLRNMPTTPAHIKQDEEQKNNHFVREIYEKELFPDRESPYGQPTNIPVLNVAFYPTERGPYNFDANDIDENGFLNDPEKRWGGIMRKIETNDFEAANIEYIEFWLMDPFVYEDQYREGDLYFNLGSVSEDILRDSRKSFEQGLPGPDETFDVDSTNWGYISKKQSMVNAFSNDPATRYAQDVGLDGLSNAEERNFYRKNPHPFLNLIDQLFGSGNLTEEAYNKILNDPASDNYHYFRGSDYDADKVSILDRYKNFNGPEGNSVPSEYSPEAYSTAATSLPDVEDINLDNTLSESENYFQYKVKLFKGMNVENNKYIVDSRVGQNSKGDPVTWYQFKIPISEPDTTVGIIRDFRSIRFMRMFLKNFNDTAILRFATLDLVRGEWRKYNQPLYDINDNVNPNPSTVFNVSAVNIEENGQKEPVNYVLPPGVDRQIDPANPQLRQLNEQALLLKTEDLARGDMRGVFKSIGMDMRQYKRLKMFVHAEAIEGEPLQDEEISVFMRLGSDYQDNYYEYEIPLKLTQPGRYNNNSTSDRYLVWPEENEFNIPLELFQLVKLRRNDKKREDGSTITFRDIFTYPDPDKPRNTVKIKGNPNLSNVRTIMIGVKTRAAGSRSFEVWVNELRLTDFNEDGGWAANARMSVKLADLGNISVAGKTNSVGFGSIEKSIMERALEDFSQYDIATNLEMGKLLGPNSRLSVPFYFGFSKSLTNPKYYPLDPDIPLKVALDNAENQQARDSIKYNSQNVVKRKSINLTNVKLKPKGNKTSIISPSNISATYAFNETSLHDPNTEYSENKNHRGILGYNFTGRPKPVEPFKKSKKLRGKGLKLIRDFNFYYLPSQISYRWEILRQYREIKLRNNTNTGNIPVTVQKDFDWNRYFDLRYNLTKSLKLNFRTATNARIDEPEGIVNKNREPDLYYEWRKQVWDNILSFGRTTNYQHNFDVSYTVPINKFPMLDWTSANVQYRAMYTWSAAALGQTNLGNNIRNSNTIQGGGQINMTSLYNKSKYLKELNRKYRSGRRQRSSGPRTVRYNKQGINLEQGKPVIINHKLKTEDVSVRIFDKKGRPVKGISKPINSNKVEFIPEVSSEGARVLVTGKVTDKKNVFKTMLDYSMLLVTSLKNGNVSYSENNGTILPGYMQQSQFLGMSSGMSAPGLPFIFGWQDRNFAWKAIDNNWLTNDSSLYQPYTMTHTQDFSAKVTLEPIRGLRIDLNAERRYSNNLNEYYLYNYTESSWGVYNPMERGSFSMTFNIIGTAFWDVAKDGNFASEAYDNFLDNRIVIAERLGNQRTGISDPGNGGLPYNPAPGPDGVDGYSLNSQDVLIPAFLAAYSDTDPNKIFLSSMPSMARLRPNWRITYDGLSRIKAFKNIIRSFDISHAYRSVYNVGSYITNNYWGSDGFISDGFSFYRNAQGDFVPMYDINLITVTEQFSPLIAFNITWVNSLSTRLEYKKSRALSLSLTNNQLIENYNDEWVIGLGYRFDKMNILLGNQRAKSDLNIRVDFSLRDNLSIIRNIEERVNQLTAGMRVTSVKVMADYALSSRFNMQLFYDTNISKPYISTTFPITNSNYGVSFRFTLTQ